MSEWRPIETAPKDGTEIIGCFVNDYGYQKTPTIYGPWTMRFRHNDWLACWDGQDVIEYQSAFETIVKTTEIEPTHWMPLPSPPTEKEPTA